MFGLFKKQKPLDQETEFVFIWYKKLVNNGKTHFTAPFRTKVKAKTREEAVDNLTDFALQKMTLQIVEENDFNSSEIMKLQKEFEELNNKFQKQIDELFKPKNTTK